jgi:hypothetical protein
MYSYMASVVIGIEEDQLACQARWALLRDSGVVPDDGERPVIDAHH